MSTAWVSATSSQSLIDASSKQAGAQSRLYTSCDIGSVGATLFASYMDESFDPKNQGVFVVGGFLGRGVAIFLNLKGIGKDCESGRILTFSISRHRSVNMAQESLRSLLLTQGKSRHTNEQSSILSVTNS